MYRLVTAVTLIVDLRVTISHETSLNDGFGVSIIFNRKVPNLARSNYFKQLCRTRHVYRTPVSSYNNLVRLRVATSPLTASAAGAAPSRALWYVMMSDALLQILRE